MSSSTINSCKLMLLGRCLRALSFSVGIQFLLLTVFLLLVNFQVLHPLHWVVSTFSLVCSLYTWFASIPLIGAVIFYGLSLSQQYLAERRYHATRYRWLLHNGPRKLLFLSAHLLFGYLTAWLYTGYLNTDYSNLTYKCYGQDCLSSYHVYLLGMGITAGCYYFVTRHMRQEVSLDFAIVELSRTEKLREVLYKTLLMAPIKSLVPTLSYSLVFWLLSPFFNQRLSLLLGVDADDRLSSVWQMLSSVRLLFYGWLLTTQILSNMHLMQRLYAMLLTERLPLVVARQRLDAGEVTIAGALGLSNAYVVQCLAAHLIFKLSQRKNSLARLEYFQLTEPGNRPVNWRALCDQYLSIVGGYTDELANAVEQLLSVKGKREQGLAQNDVNGTMLAEKLMLRQYNAMHGIRQAVSPPRNLPQQQWTQDGVRHMPNWCERVSQQLEAAMQGLIKSIPGIVYLFMEPEHAKCLYLLEHSLPIIWLTQALSHICAASLNEDRFGVVQDDLAGIIRAQYRLKCELDKLSGALITHRLSSSGFNLLVRAVRRSLYNICHAFQDYLPELLKDSTDKSELHQLQAFIQLG
ncbi:nucleoporin Ndc1 [Drosophila busckii]|nr:nucleoporin Ndc1 [Drosophila busckii]